MVRRQPLPHFSQRPGTEDNPRFVNSLSPKYKHPPVRFKVEPSPQYCDSQGKLVCTPGSCIQGTVFVQLSEPLAAVHLSLIFKASESLNYDAIGRGKRLHEERLFNIRTILWGTELRTSRSWPVMEPGYHFFPFTCEMPDVNYPSAFINNGLTRCRFLLFATLERPGQRPFMTTSLPVYFQPLVLVPSVLPFDETKRIDSDTTVHVRLRRTYTVAHDDAIAVAIQCRAPKHHHYHGAITATIALEQHYNITTNEIHNQKTMVVREIDNRRIAETGDEILLSIPLAGLPPTTDYARQIGLNYFVRITIKFRQSPLHPSKKRHRFLVPITIGSYPLEVHTAQPIGVLSYTDSALMLDRALRTEPQFLEQTESINSYRNTTMPPLPPYDPDNRPPEYIEQ